MCADESFFCDVMCSDESGFCDVTCSVESRFFPTDKWGLSFLWRWGGILSAGLCGPESWLSICLVVCLSGPPPPVRVLSIKVVFTFKT